MVLRIRGRRSIVQEQRVGVVVVTCVQDFSEI